MADVLERLTAALADRYAVQGELGQGGMATVYLADDLKHRRRVAIKVLDPELSASVGGERFLREIEVAAQLQHPHILPLYDSGQADGLCYYVMPFVEGESLRDRLNREQQLPLGDALQLAREVADALSYAHSRGVVHRDIKPENVMLSGGHALVMDFGIARALSAAGGAQLTRTGSAIGTPLYMSPEQAAGSEQIDGRSDLYSLACTLYEMLIGQPPFTGPTPQAIMARHSLEAVPSLQVVRNTVPDEVEDAVMTAMEKVPADRFQTVAQFAEALASAAPIVTTGRHTVERMRRRATRTVAAAPAPWWRRRGVLIAGPIAVLLVGALGLVGSKFLGSGATAAGSRSLPLNRIAVLYFEDRTNGELRHVADGLTEALIGELSGVDTLEVVSRSGVRPYRDGRASPDSIGRALEVGTIVEGSIAQSEHQLRVSVSVVDAETGKVLDTRTLSRPRTELFALQDTLAQEVALFLRERLGTEIIRQQRRAGTGNVQAWELGQHAEELVKEFDALLAAGDTAGASKRLDGADSLLARAAALDGKWSTPIVSLGWVAYKRLDLIGTLDKGYYSRWIDTGLVHANRALAVKATDADALELRGTLRYWRWILNLEPEARKAEQLLADARADLQAATHQNPSQAGALTLLSHMLMGQSRTAEAKVAAEHAYRADPYLQSAQLTVWRLFQSSLDLRDSTESHKWCAEGRRRFPDYFRFTECQIWMYAFGASGAEIPRAWQQLEEYVARSPHTQQAFNRLKGRIIVAMALARAGLADSARHVAERSRGDATVDPTRDLALYEAALLTMLADYDEAVTRLAFYLAANPQLRTAIARDETWWFAGLRELPAFKALVAGG